jgi:hypothetical protein
MRAAARIDRLSGMDVRAAIRRTRLPFVASLLLAALLGAPATMEAVPVTGPAGISAAAPAAAEAEIPAAEPPAEPAADTAASGVRADAPPAGRGLIHQADRALLAARAPPTV